FYRHRDFTGQCTIRNIVMTVVSVFHKSHSREISLPSRSDRRCSIRGEDDVMNGSSPLKPSNSDRVVPAWHSYEGNLIRARVPSRVPITYSQV
ncbi:hypothetical protein PENTCL1PPCAC_13283, partial [Pristionchus entomophagus]